MDSGSEVDVPGGTVARQAAETMAAEIPLEFARRWCDQKARPRPQEFPHARRASLACNSAIRQLLKY